MTAPPLRVTFRQQVREQALAVAHDLTVERGWDRVRMAEVATRTGVSRPTLYSEFGDKRGLGEALLLRESGRFVVGVQGVLDDNVGEIRRAVTAAVRYTLDAAADSPLLHAILTATRSDDAVPLLTTRSAPMLAAATETLVAWFAEHEPELDSSEVADAVDCLVRLVVSHLVLPVADDAQTAARLTRMALRYLWLDIPTPAG